MSAGNNWRPEAQGGGRTVGEAANRFVSFYIVMSIIGTVVGLGLFLFFLFYFFVPMWNSFPAP